MDKQYKRIVAMTLSHAMDVICLGYDVYHQPDDEITEAYWAMCKLHNRMMAEYKDGDE